MRLETDRLILRRWNTEDVSSLYRISSDPDVMKYFPTLLTLEETKAVVARIEKSFDEYQFGLFAVVVKEDQNVIGFVGIQNIPFEAYFTPAIEIGWRLDKNYWNKGYATEAAKRVIDYAFNDLGIKEIVAITVPENTPSRKVMAKLNMTYNPSDDFRHPLIDKNSKFSKLVLYKLHSNTN